MCEDLLENETMLSAQLAQTTLSAQAQAIYICFHVLVAAIFTNVKIPADTIFPKWFPRIFVISACCVYE